MKTKMLLIISLAVMMAGCLEVPSAASGEAGPGAVAPWTATAAPQFEIEPTSTPELIETAEPCAVVVADKALNLRGGPSEAGPVLTWLDRGEAVRVIDQVVPEWWRIEARGMVGFARSRYLRFEECER